MIQNVSWLGFGSSGTMTRTAVHFFPSSGGVTAPYAAQCRLTLFGGVSQARSVVLDGARLSQPDGVWLDDAFPEVRGANGLVGIKVEIHTAQHRIDLSASGCVLELHSGLGLSRYVPLVSGVERVSAPIPMIKDAYCSSALVVVNGSDAAVQASLATARAGRNNDTLSATISVPPVAGLSVMEVNLPETFFTNITPMECSWGLVRTSGVELTAQFPAGSAGYVIYRDAVQGHITSVRAL